MSGNDKREKKKPFRARWQQRLPFVDNYDDTDKPDFEKGSWAAFAFVLILIGIGIALMFALVD